MSASLETLAALAMDVYNREDNESYIYETEVPSIDGFAVQEGSPAPGGTNNFFANHYTSGNTIVIAFRGTDEDNAEVFGDASSVALGLPNRQIFEALKYYDQIASDPANAGKAIYLTGHSLGGALAGIVAGLRDTYPAQDARANG